MRRGQELVQGVCVACLLVKHLKGLKLLCSKAPRPPLEDRPDPSEVQAAVTMHLALSCKLWENGICAPRLTEA